MKKSVYIAIVSVLAVALLGSAIYLFSYFWQGKKSEEAYDKLRNDVTASTGEAPTTTAPETTNPGETTEFIPDPNETAPEETFPLNVDYQGFYDKNKNDDFVGWLRIEGTKLDYPVMQSSADNANYYLYRDWQWRQQPPRQHLCPEVRHLHSQRQYHHVRPQYEGRLHVCCPECLCQQVRIRQ